MKSISLAAATDGKGAVDDERVLVAAAQRDPAAFGVLYELYVTRVYRYVRAHTTSDEDAADLTQQVFLRALDALPAYRFRGVPFGAWLFRIAHRSVIDTYRRTQHVVGWDALPEGLHPASGSDLEHDLLHQEALDELRVLLGRLDSEKRELLALRFAARLSAPEIAKVVDKSPQAVKKQLTRIIQTLKERYHGD